MIIDTLEKLLEEVRALRFTDVFDADRLKIKVADIFIDENIDHIAAFEIKNLKFKPQFRTQENPFTQSKNTLIGQLESKIESLKRKKNSIVLTRPVGKLTAANSINANNVEALKKKDLEIKELVNKIETSDKIILDQSEIIESKNIEINELRKKKSRTKLISLIKSFGGILGIITIMGLIVGGAYNFGIDNGSKKDDQERFKLREENSKLKDSISILLNSKKINKKG
jgi:hypothetical protein